MSGEGEFVELSFTDNEYDKFRNGVYRLIDALEGKRGSGLCNEFEEVSPDYDKEEVMVACFYKQLYLLKFVRRLVNWLKNLPHVDFRDSDDCGEMKIDEIIEKLLENSAWFDSIGYTRGNQYDREPQRPCDIPLLRREGEHQRIRVVALNTINDKCRELFGYVEGREGGEG